MIGKLNLLNHGTLSLKNIALLNPPETISTNKNKALDNSTPIKRTDEQEEVVSGRKGVAAHQGFYVYRNERLVVDGNWLGLNKKW